MAYGKSSLDPHELQLLESEMRRREKSVGIAFLLWILVGPLFLHRVYLDRGNAWLGVGIASIVLFMVGLLTLIVLIGVVLLLIWSVMMLVMFVMWLIDAFSIMGWVADYNTNLENEVINQLLAAKGIGAPKPYGPAGYAMPAVSVNVAATGASGTNAWGSAPTAGASYPSAGVIGAGGVSARITYVESGRPNSLVVGSGEQVTVGRDSSARIRLSDPRVSRQHAMIQRVGGNWVVRDLGATNPTRLLGAGGRSQPIQGEIRFSSGQLLVGEVLLTLFPTGA
jgi:hypothetical protein